MLAKSKIIIIIWMRLWINSIDFFFNIEPKLAKTLPNPDTANNTFTDLFERNPSSMFLKPVDEK